MKSLRQNRRALMWVASVSAVAALVGAFGFIIDSGREGSRQALEERAQLRGRLAAQFTDSYLSDLASRERKLARARLGQARVDPQSFRAVVQAFDFKAAVLLDGRGRLLDVWPPRPEIVGTNLAPRYRHLRAALNGRVAVSDVVPSAARALPVVALAVPFETAWGRRVFSGAFAASRTPLGQYMRNGIPVGGILQLLDPRGNLIASSRSASGAEQSSATADLGLLEALGHSSQGTYGNGADKRWYEALPVRGTRWRLVLSVRKADLYAPIEGRGSWAPWALLAALGVAASMMLLLVARLTRARGALAAQNDRLRDVDGLKDEFVATVSHELRTPLSAIVAYLEPLQDSEAGELTQLQQRFLEVIGRNTNRLRRLVDDLLLIAQIDAGTFSLEPGEVDLSGVVADCVEAAHPGAEKRDVVLSLSVDDVPAVAGDQARLAQLFDNLISNAIKFTPAHGQVGVALQRTNGSAIVEVADTGTGIGGDEQRRVFERFFRTSEAARSSVPGTGLGLAISKAIVDAHGGRISLVSELGLGSTFRVELPLASGGADPSVHPPQVGVGHE